MPTNAFPFVMPLFWPLDANKDFMVGWKLSAYIAGSDTRKDTYSDSACTVSNEWPLVGNADGFRLFYLKPGEPYKLTLTDADDVVQPGWPIDNVCYTAAMVGLSNVTNDAQVKKSLGTAKGDLIGFSASGTPVRIPVGAVGTVLTADPTATPGVSYQSTGTNIVDTQTLTNATEVAVSVSPNISYYLQIKGLQNASNAYYKLTCNGDTASTNYSYVLSGRYSVGATLPHAEGVAFVLLTDDTAGNLVFATNEAVIDVYFSTWVSTGHKVHFRIESGWVNISGNPGGCSGNGTYSGAANLSTVTVTPSAGTITGVATLYRLN